MLTFGEKLKQARISKKLTQKQLSDKLDVSNTVISNWEKNINLPDVDILEVMLSLIHIFLSGTPAILGDTNFSAKPPICLTCLTKYFSMSFSIIFHLFFLR